MANVVQLDDQSFYLDSSTGGAKSTLKLRIGGAVLVMFTMPKCRGCNTFKPKFFEIASTHPRINFALCDLSDVKNLVAKSRASTTPLQSVPTLILYAEGIPRAKFKGAMQIPSVSSFISKGLGSISTNQPPPHPASRSAHSMAAPMPSAQQHTLITPPQHNPAKFSGGHHDTSPYASLGNPEEDDDSCLLMPNGICPYNQPWSSEFKHL